jgi:catechol 2,3-dioxygenase-like lactoylglutathione lyase family enzyme
MALGIAMNYMTGIADLAASRAFYQAVGFRTIDSGQEPYPWAQLTDGQLVVGLHQDGHLYRGLAYFGRGMAAQAAALEEAGVPMPVRNERPDGFFQAILLPESTLPVSLIEFAAATPPAARQPNPRLGVLGELALAVPDLSQAIAKWGLLGFEVRHRESIGDHYQWAILSDGLLPLGLHQTADFSGPALTYFAPDMEQRLQQLAAAGVEISNPMPDEEGHVRNAIVQAPDGQEWFFFEGNLDSAQL